jgi:hypothetical protein
MQSASILSAIDFKQNIKELKSDKGNFDLMPLKDYYPILSGTKDAAVQILPTHTLGEKRGICSD